MPYNRGVMLEVSIADIVEREGYEIDDVFMKNGIGLYLVYLSIKVAKYTYKQHTLYVGSSNRPWRRVLAHLGKNADYPKQPPSTLGDFIISHYKEASWAHVQFCTEEWCRDLVIKYNTEARLNAGEFKYQHPHLTPGEQALIEEYRPCLNYNTNTYQSPVPKLYEQWRLDRVKEWPWLIGEV